MFRVWRVILDILDTLYLFQSVIQWGGGGAMTAWLSSWIALPLETKIPALIAIFAIAFLLIKFLLYLLRIPKAILERRLARQIRLNKTINNILVIAETMDNEIYKTLPELEKQPTKEKIDALFSSKVFWFLALHFAISIRRGIKRLALFLDDNQIGLASAKDSSGYKQQEAKLNQDLRLKSVYCRNSVYDFIEYSYDFNSTLYLARRLKAIGKLEELPFPIHLAISLKVRELENKRRQGIGNMLNRLALKLEGRCK